MLHEPERQVEDGSARSLARAELADAQRAEQMREAAVEMLLPGSARVQAAGSWQDRL